MATPLKKTKPKIPLSRVKTIMRSSPEVSSLSPDAIALTAHSAELFISQLVRDALAERPGSRRLEYKHLAEVVATHPRMAFLQDILPKKVKVKDFLRMRHEMDERNACDLKESTDSGDEGKEVEEETSSSD